MLSPLASLEAVTPLMRWVRVSVIRRAPLACQQPPRGKVAHQRARSKLPRRRVARRRYNVRQRAEFRARDPHLIADLVGEPAPGLVTVLGRREQGTEEQHEAVRIMMLAERLADQLGRIAADLAHPALPLKPETVGAGDLQLDHRRADV